MEKKERDMEKPVGTHMNPTGTLHRDIRIYKEGHGKSRKGRGGQWGRNLGTLPAGETDVTLGDAILGQKFPIGTHFRDKTPSPSHPNTSVADEGRGNTHSLTHSLTHSHTHRTTTITLAAHARRGLMICCTVDGQTSVCVSYTGVSIGSTATYTTSDNFCIDNKVLTRSCTSDMMWEDMTPTGGR